MGIRKRSWSGRWTQTKYTKLQWLTFNKTNPNEKLLDGSTYIGARGGGQGGRRMSQGSLKPTLGHTRLMGPSGGDATPFDLLFDSDSAAASDCFVAISTLRANLKVNPIGLEREQNQLSNKKVITQFGVRMKKLLAF